MGGSKRQTTGYKYFMGLHMGICHGPVDAVTEIRVADRVAWSGNVTASSRITIDQPALFGGKKKEGGIQGGVDIMLGESTQPVNDYLNYVIGGVGGVPEDTVVSPTITIFDMALELGQSRPPAAVPAAVPSFRGILSIVARHCYIAANNPYIKPWAIRVKRLLAGWNTPVWYAAKIEPTAGNMNPAHIVYQCLTDNQWGMGTTTDQIDADNSFTSAADTLYSEGFGLSLIWNQQSEIEDFIQQVMDHVGGVFRVSPSTGKFELKLVRDDYDVETILHLDESNVVDILSFSRASLTDTVNELTVIYTNPDTGKDEPITVQNLANIQSQGQVVSQTNRYPGVTVATLAARLANRDLNVLSQTLAKVRLTANREAWQLAPGDVFKLSWPKLGVSNMVFRVGNVNRGTLRDRTITIEAVQDVFGLPATTYSQQQEEGWYEQDGTAYPIFAQALQEATYYDVVTTLPTADVQALDAATTGFILPAAAKPAASATGYTVWSKIGATEYENTGVGDFVPACILDAAIGKEEQTVAQFRNGIELEQVEIGTYCFIGTGQDAERAAVVAVDLNAATVTLNRGILDTVPAVHPEGTLILFSGFSTTDDQVERVDGETIDVKLLPVLPQGEILLADAANMQVTMNQRYYRPLPPGRFRINAQIYPDYMVGTLAVGWAHRDRTQQTADLIPQGDGDIGPEAGTTYEISIYDRSDVLLRSVTGLTTTSYSYTDEVADAGELQGRLKVQLLSRRDGVSSWQQQIHTFDRAGWSLNYGLYYGAGT